MFRFHAWPLAAFAMSIVVMQVSCTRPVASSGKSGKTVASSATVASIRRDLELSSNDAIEILGFESIPTEGRWDTREEAVILTSANGIFQVALIHREPTSINPNFSRWSVGMVSLMDTDGTDRWEVFQRQFDHRPDEEDVAEFKKWIAQW